MSNSNNLNLNKLHSDLNSPSKDAKYQTPQMKRSNKNLFNTSSREKQYLLKSADRFIPKRNSTNIDLVSSVFEEKIKNLKNTNSIQYPSGLKRTKTDPFHETLSSDSESFAEKKKTKVENAMEKDKRRNFGKLRKGLGTLIDDSRDARDGNLSALMSWRKRQNDSSLSIAGSSHEISNISTENAVAENNLSVVLSTAEFSIEHLNESTEASEAHNELTIDETHDASLLRDGKVVGIKNDDSFCHHEQRKEPRFSSPNSAKSKTSDKRTMNALNSMTFLGFMDSLWGKRALSYSVQGEDRRKSSLFKRSTNDLIDDKERKRTIQKNAEKVLDAPDIGVKSSLNLIHWTCASLGSSKLSDVLAVALAEEVYFWVVEKNTIESLKALMRKDTEGIISEKALADSEQVSENGTEITSVLWFRSYFLAVGRENSTVDIYSFQDYFESLKENKEILKRVVLTHHFELPSAPCFDKDHFGRVSALLWNSGRKLLFCGTKQGSVFVYRFSGREAKAVAVLRGARAEVCRLSWDPLELTLAVGSRDSVCYLFGIQELLAAGKLWRCLGKSVSTSQAQKSGSKKVDPMQKFESRILHVDPLSKVKCKMAIKALAWCPWSSGVLVVGANSGEIKVYDLIKAEKANLHEENKQRETARSLSLTKTRACSKLKKADERRETLFDLPVFSTDTEAPVTGLEFLPRHRELVSSHAGPKARLFVWSFPEMVVLASLAGHTRRILGIAVNASRTLVASASSDESIRIWRVAEEKQSPTANEKCIR